MSSHKQPPLKLSPKARQDFVDILRYTGETWGQNQLLVYRDKINDALVAISQTP
jgi:plasmid stabilization system protein ParE